MQPTESKRQAEIGAVVMEAVKAALREKIGDRLARRIDSRGVRKRLTKKLFEFMFYELLSTGELKLPPGLGSLRTVELGRKMVKVFDKKRKIMVERPANTRKILYRPGDTIREFL